MRTTQTASGEPNLNHRILVFEAVLIKKPEPAEVIEDFADAERGEIGDDDSDERANPIARFEQIFAAKGEPEKETFAERREGFGDDQVKRS